jgi:MSHA biogenesis protein MshQ
MSMVFALALALFGGTARAAGTNYTLPAAFGSGFLSSCVLAPGTTTYNCSSSINLSNNGDTFTSTTSDYTLNITGSLTTSTGVVLGSSTFKVNVIASTDITIANNSVVYGNLTANSGTITLANSANTDIYGNVSAATINMGNNAYVTGNCSSSACANSCNGTLPGSSDCGSTVTTPLVTTVAASSITDTSVTLNGTVVPNQTQATTSFNYGTTTGYGNTVTATPSPLSASANSTAIAYSLSGLTCNTTYHFRATATNAAGLTNGGDMSFTTSACSGGPDHYELSIPGSSISCLASTVTVTACADSTTPCTTAYTTSMSGKTATLATSAGTLGATSVIFNASGVATTTLSYAAATNGATATVTLSGEQTAATNARKCCLSSPTSCSTSASCTGTFSTAGFIVASAAGGAAATLPTTTSGATSGTYYLRAVQTSTTTQKCESALSASSAVTLGYTCVTPNSCTSGSYLDVTPYNVAAPQTLQPVTAAGTSVNLYFDANGNAPFTFRYRDSGQINLTASKAAGGSLLTALSGTSNTFTVNPAYFNTTVTPACTSSTNFTYSGQPFSVTVTAKESSAGATTPNYSGSSGAKTVTLSDANALATGALSTTGTTCTPTAGTGCIDAGSFGSVVLGEATVATLTFTFNSKSTGPQTIKLRATDTASVSSSAGTEQTALIYSGRLRLSNANGSELLALPIPAYVEYYKSAADAWQTNALDTSCTTLAASDFAFSYPVNTANKLVACETAVTVAGSPPTPTISLTKPGAGNDGWVDLTLNLGASAAGNRCTAIGAAGAASTTANKPWLQFNWSGTTGNPTARARFGAPKSGPTIHQRELY